jgi:lysophospholipase-2
MLSLSRAFRLGLGISVSTSSSYRTVFITTNNGCHLWPHNLKLKMSSGGGGGHITTRQGDGTILVSPRNESDQSASIIICHGLGDTAEGFVDVAEQLSTQLPYVKFILPTAPTQKVTMNMGMAMPSWYDIVGLDKRSNEFCKGIDESQARLTNIISSEMTELGLPRNRIVLAGFSQGGALSLYTGMQLLPLPSSSTSIPDTNDDATTTITNPTLAGIVILSGYLPHASAFRVTPGLESTPIWHGHGTIDPLVKIEAAKESQSTLMTQHKVTNYTLQSYPGLAHSINPQELSDVLTFLRKVLPPNDTYKIKLKDPVDMSIKELKAAISKAGLGHRAVGFMEKREFVELLRQFRQQGKL